MHHAILITAYKDLQQLATIASCFDQRFALYVHIDRKTVVPKLEMESLKAIRNIVFIGQQYKVNWGGRNHLKSILLLCKEALKDDKIEYLHLITAQDLPIKSSDQFIDHFSTLDGNSYLEHFDMPAACWHNGGWDRILRYNLYDNLNAKKHMHWIQKLLAIQKKLGLRRSYNSKLPKLFGGSTYWSLHREAVKTVINFTQEKPALLRRMRHTFCSEEFYFQTVLMNSPLKDSFDTDNKRYILWKQKHGSQPGILDMDDLPTITASKALFARKFDLQISSELTQHLLRDRND